MRRIRFRRLACVIIGVCFVGSVVSPAQTYTKLVNFDGVHGSGPIGPLVQGTNGNLYGVTNAGGSSSYCPNSSGCGTVFEVTAGGKLTFLHNFCQKSKCADGAAPAAGLVLATNGNFYGMTSDNVANGGTIFEITPAGKFTTLYSFCAKSANCPDGEGPLGVLMQAGNGNLYGVTTAGGDYTHCAGGCGLIFEITLAGVYSTFHVFCSTTECTHDGRNPRTGLIQATNGNYIGTTSGGGPGQSGVVYEITPSSKLTFLHDFCSQLHCTDGDDAGTPPIQATNGNLYGTTLGGGTNDGGTFYELTLAKQFTDLYDFCSQKIGIACADGDNPTGLVQGSDGNFYAAAPNGGTSSLCGSSACGVLFEITSTGGYTLLYDFCSTANCADGGQPSGGLVQSTNGTFYGTTGIGGTGSGCAQGLGCGAIYTLSVGLGPFVEALPNFGAAGRVVGILGSQLSGTTSVSFNGTQAKFTVVSNTLIEATVPTGAATGTIQVTTPEGTLSSNVAFQVSP